MFLLNRYVITVILCKTQTIKWIQGKRYDFISNILHFMNFQKQLYYIQCKLISQISFILKIESSFMKTPFY